MKIEKESLTEEEDNQISNEKRKRNRRIFGGLLVGAAVSIFGLFALGVMSLVAFLRFVENMVNPDAETVQANIERTAQLREEQKDRVLDNFVFDIPITQSEFLPDMGDVLLVSLSDNPNAYIHYIPLDQPKLVAWEKIESDFETYNDTVVLQVPTVFHSKFLIDDEGW